MVGFGAGVINLLNLERDWFWALISMTIGPIRLNAWAVAHFAKIKGFNCWAMG